MPLIDFLGKTFNTQDKVEFNYDGDNENIDEEKLKQAVQQFKNDILKVIMKRDISPEVGAKFIFKISGKDLFPHKFNTYEESEQQIILKKILTHMTDTDATLQIMFAPLSASHFAMGSVDGVGVVKTSDSGGASG